MRKLVAVFAGLVLALGAACVFLLMTREPTRREIIDAATRLPDVRREATQELIARTGGVWDSFPDPDVGRVLLRDLEGRMHAGVPIDSNAYGMRERGYAQEKPEGSIRVVLLGDSFVYGMGGLAEDRFGVFLQRFLRKRRSLEGGAIEVLHLGASSWNLVAECSYLRRQLSILDPDLVIHVTVENDLEDVAGVRGFGAMANFSPQVRARGDARIGELAVPTFEGQRVRNLLPEGLDGESHARLASSAQAVRGLRDALRARGTPYLVLFHWSTWSDVANRHIGAGLAPEERAFVSRAFRADKSTWISPQDQHWNRNGNERIARLLYGLIVERDLLPAAAPAPWDAAANAVRAIHAPGQAELEEPRGLPRIATRYTVPATDAEMARQVYIGLDADGTVGAYLSLVLANESATTLRLEGVRLERPELSGTARVFVDELEVGSFGLGGGAPFPLEFPLPESVRGRAAVNVRVESTDWVYAGMHSGRAQTFRLTSVSLD